MKIRIFGKDLFEIRKSSAGQFIEFASSEAKTEKTLPDFMKIGTNDWSENFASLVEVSTIVSEGKVPGKKGTKKQEPVQKPERDITPKELFALKLLDDKSFQLKTDPAYIDSQLADFKDKLALIQNYESVRGGIGEIKSILTRLENRKNYAKFHDFYDQYPYTMSSKITELLKKHSHLKNDVVAAFVPDMPKEAMDVMKEYSAKTKELCGKEPVFYIIANKKDFERKVGRRDPILLAQSPFGHFWQILGAWDEEMLLVEEL